MVDKRTINIYHQSGDNDIPSDTGVLHKKKIFHFRSGLVFFLVNYLSEYHIPDKALKKKKVTHNVYGI